MKRFSEGIFERRLQTVPASDHICVYALVANTAHTPIPIPVGATVMLMTAAVDVAIRFGTVAVAATLPSAEQVDGAASDLCPANAKVPFEVLPGTTHVSLIAASDAKVTVAWYSA